MNKFVLILTLLLSLFLFSCSTTVGDSCQDEADCDQGLVCDVEFPGGYCLKQNCNIYNSESCPDSAQCTYFAETEMTYCLAKCNENDDCRTNYECSSVSNNEYRVCLPKK